MSQLFFDIPTEHKAESVNYSCKASNNNNNTIVNNSYDIPVIKGKTSNRFLKQKVGTENNVSQKKDKGKEKANQEKKGPQKEKNGEKKASHNSEGRWRRKKPSEKATLMKTPKSKNTVSLDKLTPSSKNLLVTKPLLKDFKKSLPKTAWKGVQLPMERSHQKKSTIAKSFAKVPSSAEAQIGIPNSGRIGRQSDKIETKKRSKNVNLVPNVSSLSSIKKGLSTKRIKNNKSKSKRKTIQLPEHHQVSNTCSNNTSINTNNRSEHIIELVSNLVKLIQ